MSRAWGGIGDTGPVPARARTLQAVDTGTTLAPAGLIEVARDLAMGTQHSLLALFDQSVGRIRQQVATAEAVFDCLRWLWDADEVSGVEIDIALSGLLLAFRRAAPTGTPRARGSEPSRIMVANAPSEPHFQQASLASELLRREGYDVELWLGQDADDLFNTVSASDLDHLVISTSPVFGRASESRLADIHRLAGLNGQAGVILLGRFSLAPRDVLGRAGFAHYCLSALELPDLVAARERMAH